MGSKNPEILKFGGFGPSHNKIKNIRPKLIRIIFLKMFPFVLFWEIQIYK